MKRTFTARNLAHGSPTGALTHGQFYLSGAAAGISNSILASPIEQIRIRLQTQTTQKLFNGPIDTIKKIYSAAGVRGVFRGLAPTMMREGHGTGAYFLTFEALVARDMKKNGIQRRDIPGWRLCMYGAFAGYAMWSTVYPIDMIKSKLQTDALEPSKRKYKGIADCFRKTLAESGVKGFFKGFWTTILRAAPANAATFYVFELAIRYLG